MYSKFAMITFLDSPPNVSGGIPDNSLPGGGQINNGLPGNPTYPTTGPISPGHPIQLPVYPFDPTVPSNELPTNPPPTIWPPVPGQRFKLKWLACVGLILVPDNSLPETAEPK